MTQAHKLARQKHVNALRNNLLTTATNNINRIERQRKLESLINTIVFYGKVIVATIVFLVMLASLNN